MADSPNAAPGAERARAARRAILIRLLVSPLNLAVVVAVLVVHDRTGNPLPSDLLLFVLGAAGAYELARLFRVNDVPVLPWLAALGSGLAAGVGLFAPLPESGGSRMEARAVVVAASFVLLLLIHLKDVRRSAADRIAFSMVPIVYVGLLLGFVREVGVGPQMARWLLWVVLISKASDIGGWLVGKPFGRHKLIPGVSPGKSWEGLVGGLAFSVAVAVFVPSLLDLPAAEWTVPRRVTFGLVLGLASVLAGITQSGWKRRFDAKDSSTLIPEIGGVLDLIDSMLLAGPAAWLWFRLGL